MNVIWINGHPYIDDDRCASGLRPLSLYELEQEGAID